MKKETHRQKKGFSLLELVIAIGLITVAVGAMSATVMSFRLRQTSNFRSLAYALAEEELASLKTIPFSNLANVASSTFLGVLYNLGTFNVTSSLDAASAPNVYTITASGTAVNTFTNLRTFPVSTAKAVSLNFKVRFPSNPPANWATGAVFRASDYKNYYRLVLKSTGLELAKAVNGTITVLSTYSFTPTANTWYTLGVSANDTSITTYVNGINTGTITDTDLINGEVAIMAQNGLQSIFDDCILSTDYAASSTWNFDGATAGIEMPEFKKFGVYSLPLGRDELTIENYLGQTDFKKITASVYWTERGVNKGITLQTLRNN